MSEKKLPHVVIIGGGFGGLTAARSLRRAPVRITLVDRTNHHLFQPLLYQVAMAGVSPADIASPIRSILHGQKNVSVRLADVLSVDLKNRAVTLHDGRLEYDYLVLAAGTTNNYFGHDEWERFAPGLKTLDDAVEIRRRVLLAFEEAEYEPDAARREQLLTMVVIGGGPTGVELAGALAELSRFVLAKDFRAIDPTHARVILLEGGPRILNGFPEHLSEKAVRQLKELGVEVRTGARVTAIDANGVELGGERIPSVTVLWGAGVRASPITATLGVPLDRAGRVKVEKDTSIPGFPEAFAIGDIAALDDGHGGTLPGVSQVAMQEAEHAAAIIAALARGEKPERGAFSYFDKGNMATIGRSRAIAHTRWFQASGLFAWLLWLLVHIWFLIGFRNRLVVMFNWFVAYVTYGRGARLITGQRLEPGAPVRVSALPSPPVSGAAAARAQGARAESALAGDA